MIMMNDDEVKLFVLLKLRSFLSQIQFIFVIDKLFAMETPREYHLLEDDVLLHCGGKDQNHFHIF